MKVFISWSGQQSKAVAAALHEWIPYVINEADPFMSADSIESGQRWSAVLANELDKTNFGIVCTSASNQQEPWLNFEAGALAKSIGEARVIPLAIDLALTEIRQPLGQFNAVTMDQDGITKMMHSLNTVAEKKIEPGRLDQAIEKWWPDLATKLSAITPDAPTSIPKRDDSEVLLEVLDTVRGIARTVPDLLSGILAPSGIVTPSKYVPYPELRTEPYSVGDAIRRGQLFDWLVGQKKEWTAEEVLEYAKLNGNLTNREQNPIDHAEDVALREQEAIDRAENIAQREEVLIQRAEDEAIRRAEKGEPL